MIYPSTRHYVAHHGMRTAQIMVAPSKTGPSSKDYANDAEEWAAAMADAEREEAELLAGIARS